LPPLEWLLREGSLPGAPAAQCAPSNAKTCFQSSFMLTTVRRFAAAAAVTGVRAQFSASHFANTANADKAQQHILAVHS
jgi:hypothetical protein